MSTILYVQQHPLVSLLVFSVALGFLMSVAATLDLVYKILPWTGSQGIGRLVLWALGLAFLFYLLTLP